MSRHVLSRSLSRVMLRLAVAILVAGKLEAAPVLYTFVGFPNLSSPGVTDSFQYRAPDFITIDSPGVIEITGVLVLPLQLSQLEWCIHCAAEPGAPAVLFYPDLPVTHADEIQFNSDRGIGWTTVFPDGVFTTPGLHLSSPFGPDSDSGVLTVQVVPEPSTAILAAPLLIAGFVAVIRRIRRRDF